MDLMQLRSFELRKEDLTMAVGPGLHKEELNALLEPHGFLLGPDPASNPSIGGMCSTSGSGLSTLRYGTTRENVVSLLVVLADGTLKDTSE